MSVKIKGRVDVGHTYTGTNGNFEYDLEDLGITPEDWLDMDSKQRKEFLDDILNTEIDNTLDAAIWTEEGEED